MQDENNTNHPEPEYIYDEEIHKGLRELLADKTMLKMFSVTPEEIEWLKTVIIEIVECVFNKCLSFII